jgi:hypothetical protein
MSSKTYQQKLARGIQRCGEDETGTPPQYMRCLALANAQPRRAEGITIHEQAAALWLANAASLRHGKEQKP